MLLSLSLILLAGYAIGRLFETAKLPRLVGMLLTGIILGPFVLNLLDDSLLSLSADLRKLALIIILLKAGLSLRLSDLKKVGRPALLLSFVPASFEIVGYLLFAPLLLGVSRLEAALMGAVMAAVSPAVIVPKMVTLMEEGYGMNKSIPPLLLAGSSLDDIFVIVMFTVFTGMAQGNGVSVGSFAQIPVSIALGLLIGTVFGLALHTLFKHIHMRDSAKVILLLGAAMLLVSVEQMVQPWVAMSGLLAVMSMTMILAMRRVEVAERLSAKFSRLWVAAEIVLFVLVGAAVDIRYTLQAGVMTLAMIALGLAIRSLGTGLSLAGTSLTVREKLFCMVSYLPKATVQSAIGAVPLSLGLGCGPIVLTVAVTGILLTAPLGSLLIDLTYRRWLNRIHEGAKNPPRKTLS